MTALGVLVGAFRYRQRVKPERTCERALSPRGIDGGDRFFEKMELAGGRAAAGLVGGVEMRGHGFETQGRVRAEPLQKRGKMIRRDTLPAQRPNHRLQ